MLKLQIDAIRLRTILMYEFLLSFPFLSTLKVKEGDIVKCSPADKSQCLFVQAHLVY